jgi:eukaryotic-like serine/threonine-protein kinase
MPEWLGKTIGKVRIDKYLARGGMAEVYLGMHTTLDRPVAVKVLHAHIEENPDMMARFQREAKVVAALRHPNIVQIYDFDAVDGHPYIVMEYLSGPTLANYLRAEHSRGERIPPHQVARLLKGITAALDYAHAQGVIHRDIKPGNILLQSNSGEISLNTPLSRDVEGVLTDFGLVRISNSASQTASGTVSGTAAYMSPEQARGDKTDHRTDIYSLGIVLYEMLAGRVPFEADSSLSVIYMQINEPPPAINGISQRVQTVMDRALKKNPEERYNTSREMAVDFYKAIGMNTEAETILEAAPLPSHAAATVSINPQPARSRGLLAGVIAGVLVLAVAGVFIFRSLAGAPPTSTPETQTTDPALTTPSESAPETEVINTLPSAENMVEIPSGSYIIGREPADDYHIAPQTVQLEAFWIDQFQVTNAQYQRFVAETGAPPPAENSDTANRPVRGVAWEQANAYCAWQNKRLPDEAEWEAAGRGGGPNPQLYPWGNDASTALSLPEQDTYDVGTLSINASPFGVFDLVGNVWEWTGEPYAFVQNGFKILRGGRFGLPQDLAYRLAVSADGGVSAQYAGFRCAADQVK